MVERWHQNWRNTDPDNSKLAGLAVDLKNSQEVAYNILKANGPISDEQIADIAEAQGSTYDPSRLRHARKDLVEAGLAEKVGDTVTKRGRTTALWDLAKPAEALW